MGQKHLAKTHREIMERMQGRCSIRGIAGILGYSPADISGETPRGHLRYLRHNGPGKRLVHDKQRTDLPLPCMTLRLKKTVRDIGRATPCREIGKALIS